MLASLPVGFCFGSIEVVLPAFSDSHGERELSGALIAVWAAASAAAGLVYGARPPRGSLETAHLGFAFLLPIGVATLLISTSPSTMLVLAALAGAPVAPLVASRNQLVERVTPRGTATEAFTWPLTALVSGVAIGASVAGSLTESHSWSVAVLVAVAVASAGALIVLTRRGTLAPRAPA